MTTLNLKDSLRTILTRAIAERPQAPDALAQALSRALGVFVGSASGVSLAPVVAEAKAQTQATAKELLSPIVAEARNSGALALPPAEIGRALFSVIAALRALPATPSPAATATVINNTIMKSFGGSITTADLQPRAAAAKPPAAGPARQADTEGIVASLVLTQGNEAVPDAEAVNLSAAIPGYRFMRLLGRGGFARVYLATREVDGNVCAVKVASSSDAGRVGLEIEVMRHLASLRHPNLITYLDHGEATLVVDRGKTIDVIWVAMADVAIGTLHDLLHDPRGVSLEDVFRLSSQLLAGLEALHNQGIVHRDLKPGNVLIDQAGNARLTDFGLAKEMLRESGMTVSGELLGTPAYMSPEQVQGREVTPATDIWALGAIIFEMFTGRRLFDAPNIMALGQQIHEGGQRIYSANVAAPVRAFLQQCMVIDPAGRFVTATQARVVFERYAGPIVRWFKATRGPRAWQALDGADAIIDFIANEPAPNLARFREHIAEVIDPDALAPDAAAQRTLDQLLSTGAQLHGPRTTLTNTLGLTQPIPRLPTTFDAGFLLQHVTTPKQEDAVLEFWEACRITRFHLLEHLPDYPDPPPGLLATVHALAQPEADPGQALPPPHGTPQQHGGQQRDTAKPVQLATSSLVLRIIGISAGALLVLLLVLGLIIGSGSGDSKKTPALPSSGAPPGVTGDQYNLLTSDQQAIVREMTPVERENWSGVSTDAQKQYLRLSADVRAFAATLAESSEFVCVLWFDRVGLIDRLMSIEDVAARRKALRLATSDNRFLERLETERWPAFASLSHQRRDAIARGLQSHPKPGRVLDLAVDKLDYALTLGNTESINAFLGLSDEDQAWAVAHLAFCVVQRINSHYEAWPNAMLTLAALSDEQRAHIRASGDACVAVLALDRKLQTVYWAGDAGDRAALLEFAKNRHDIRTTALRDGDVVAVALSSFSPGALAQLAVGPECRYLVIENWRGVVTTSGLSSTRIGSEISRLRLSEEQRNAYAFEFPGHVVVGDSEGAIQLVPINAEHRFESGSLIGTAPSAVSAIAITPDGATIVVGMGDGSLAILERGDGDLAWTARDVEYVAAGEVVDVAIRHDARFVAVVHKDRRVRVVQLETLSTTTDLNEDSSTYMRYDFRHAVWHPNGNELVLDALTTIALYDSGGFAGATSASDGVPFALTPTLTLLCGRPCRLVGELPDGTFIARPYEIRGLGGLSNGKPAPTPDPRVLIISEGTRTTYYRLLYPAK